MKIKLMKIISIIFILAINYSCTTTNDYFESKNEASTPIIYDHIYISITIESDGKFAVELDTGEEQFSYSTGVKLSDYEQFLTDMAEDISYLDPELTKSDLEGYRPNLGGEKIHKKLKYYGKAFFSPIKQHIEKTDKIIIVISKDSLELMPDLFIYNEQYLYLQKPIIYSFSKNYTVEPIYQDDWSFLLASDKTADPERAILKVRDIFNNTTYRDETNASDLSELIISANNYEVILTSCHGHITEDTSQGLYIGRYQYGPNHFKKSTAKIIFFDACDVGVSKGFINVMAENETKIYIAAVMASDAGEASSMLILEFCKNLEKGLSPSMALYKTKVKLADHFKDDIEYLRLWRSFLYRVYYM